MTKGICTVQVNGETFTARRGELLLDAALMNGVEIPHDCRSGHCGTCCVRVVEGRYFGGDASESGLVRACQCRMISDMAVTVEQVPDVSEISGHVSELLRVAPDVFEVCVLPSRPLHYLPGQYFSVRWRGYPARCYSPTVPLDWPSDPRVIRFHVRRFPDGRVSSAFGGRIAEGHRVKVTGPLGSAFLRPGHPGRLVLVSSGTGFAPIWAIAEAAVRERPQRELMLIAGARSLQSLYMIPALCRLALLPNVKIIPVVSERQTLTQAVRQGRPADWMPSLSADDIVYTAGAPEMVRAIARIAEEAGAACFSDPFAAEPAGREAAGLLTRLAASANGLRSFRGRAQQKFGLGKARDRRLRAAAS